ncbi:MAG: DNA starvation/stationary phase protection protein Dps [Planctomycetaceae bacterium]|uniref:DNA protection during starvation protein n=1 Tax=Lacipirellula limnantheis TaxID=2528024 RepID=A0A517TTT3_9BACT|nr:DNA starvation/stationary phase protection protein Dps [Lacipirellula limnantheis]MBL9165969.1 DNA starvation/stationary phase protection protein Dps [Planctomycetaceae bacterium]QDT71773.1 DNA protection during starvation protein [Lacipirellula limnantheis]
MNPTKNDLPAEKRDAAIKLLNALLADLIDLQLQAKQAHWNVKGPNFIALHELFDSVAEEAEGLVDTVAERIAALGGRAEGTIDVVGKRSMLAPYPLDITSGQAHVDALSTSMAMVGKATRSGVSQAAEIGDAGTADLFTEVSRGIDKKLWFVESHLQGDR